MVIAIMVAILIIIIISVVVLAACKVGTQADHEVEDKMRLATRCGKCGFEVVWFDAELLTKHKTTGTTECPNCHKLLKVHIEQ